MAAIGVVVHISRRGLAAKIGPSAGCEGRKIGPGRRLVKVRRNPCPAHGVRGRGNEFFLRKRRHKTIVLLMESMTSK